jgi:hypothetical protein
MGLNYFINIASMNVNLHFQSFVRYLIVFFVIIQKHNNSFETYFHTFVNFLLTVCFRFLKHLFLELKS